MAEEFHQKLPFREKFGYALGDVATNFFFQSMILYQNRFYTDTVGLSPAVLGWIFLLGTIWVLESSRERQRPAHLS